jgi:hypothetical protein
MIDGVTLRELLNDPDCPYGRDGADIVAALREQRTPTKTRYISLRELAPFVATRTGHEVEWRDLDRLMVEEIGARPVSLIDMQGLLGRSLRRLLGRKTSAPPVYEVLPGVPPDGPC